MCWQFSRHARLSCANYCVDWHSRTPTSPSRPKRYQCAWDSQASSGCASSLSRFIQLIIHRLHIVLSLLIALTEQGSSGNSAKIKINRGLWQYFYLQYASYWAYKAPARAAHFFMAVSGKKMRASNRQDFVFISQPGISHGAFQLRMDNVWFCIESAKFCCCFRTSQKQISAGRGTRVPSSLYWRNTLDLGELVNYLEYLEDLVSSGLFEHLLHSAVSAYLTQHTQITY